MKPRLLAFIILLAAFALRIYQIGAQSLWTDEGYALDFATQSAQRMLAMWQSWQPDTAAVVVSGLSDSDLASATDTHAPLHYFLLHYWLRLAGQSEFAARFPSLFFGLLVVPVLYALGHRLLDRRAGLYAAALGAASPLYIAYAQEARMYTMSLLLSTISVYLTVRIIQHSYSRIHVAGYVLSTALALYTHYFAAFVVIFENIFVIGSLAASFAAGRMGKGTSRASERESSIKRTVAWLLAQACVLLLLLPWLGVILKQLQFPRNEALPVPPLLEVVAWYWQALNAPIKAVPQGTETYLLMLVILAGALILARCVVDRASRPAIALILLYLFVPLALTIVVVQRQPMFHPRYLIAASPAYYLALAVALGSLRRLHWAPPHFACAALVGVFLLGLNSYYFDSSFAKDDARAAGSFLTGDSSAEDLVVLDYPEPIGHYYKGKAPYVFLPGDRAVALKALNELGVGKRRIHYVQWWQSRTDLSGYISYLLSREGRLLGQRQFRGFRIDKYELRAGLTRFADDAGVRETDVNFDGLLQLQAVGYGTVRSGDGEAEPASGLRQGGKLWVLLRWKLLQETADEYKAFVRLAATGGDTVGQSDSFLLKGQLRTDQWQTGDTQETYHLVPLLPGTPPGEYQLEAGIYEAKTQRRVSVVDRNLTPMGASTPLGKVGINRFPERLASASDNAAPADLGVARLLRANLDSLRLLGYSLSSRTLTQGDTIRLTLLWRADRDVGEDYSFRLDAIAKAGPPEGYGLRERPSKSYPTKSWIQGQLIRDWRDYQIPPRLAPGQYQLRGRLTRLPEGSSVGTVDLGELEVRDRPYNTSVPPGISRSDVQFGDLVEIVGHELRPEVSTLGETIELTLYWRAMREMDKSFTVFTHLLDGGNRVRAQHDGLPASGALPTTSWRAGEVVADKHQLTVNKGAPPGDYVIEVGLYDAISGKRLAASSPAVEIMGDGALIRKIAVR